MSGLEEQRKQQQQPDAGDLNEKKESEIVHVDHAVSKLPDEDGGLSPAQQKRIM